MSFPFVPCLVPRLVPRLVPCLVPNLVPCLVPCLEPCLVNELTVQEHNLCSTVCSFLCCISDVPPRVILNNLPDFSDMTLSIKNWDNPFRIDFEPIKA